MMIKEDRLRDILGHVATKCGMIKWRYEPEDTSETTETYFGVLIPFTVIGVIQDKEISEPVFIKLPVMDESLRAFSGYLWDTEAYVYSTLVPLWDHLSNVKMNEFIPKCYYADATPNNQVLVLKDMRCKGFQKYEAQFLDYDHVIASLRSLAKFHALSLILKKHHGDLTASTLRPYTDTYPVEFNQAILKSFRAHYPLFKGSKYEHYWKEILTNYKKIVMDSTSKAKCLVYGHGDYWKGNIMYKYEVSKHVKACTLDFQMCQLMSPAFDFLFFLLNSTDGSLRRLYYDDFLTEYYACFKKTLFDHDIQLESIYKKEDFISDLKTVASVCFIRICLAFSLWLGFESDSIVRSKNLWETDQERHKELCYFKEILVNVMEDLCKFGYISF